jgi:hypothetical protein
MPSNDDARTRRLVAACRRGDKVHSEQVALVLRMIEYPQRPLIELRDGRAARVHARGALDGPQRYRSPLNRQPDERGAW